MRDIQDFVTATQAKKDFLEILRRVQDLDQTVAITKNGLPTAVLLSFQHFESLLETLDILNDEKTLKALRKAQKEFKEGKVLTHEEVWGK